jgi:hypothetical protein
MTVASLTLADAARMMREAVKDRSYVDNTGLGRVDGVRGTASVRKPNRPGLQGDQSRPPLRVAGWAACDTSSSKEDT